MNEFRLCLHHADRFLLHSIFQMVSIPMIPFLIRSIKETVISSKLRETKRRRNWSFHTWLPAWTQVYLQSDKYRFWEEESFNMSSWHRFTLRFLRTERHGVSLSINTNTIQIMSIKSMKNLFKGQWSDHCWTTPQEQNIRQ